MTRTLEKSPIFNLSMASKELFHSNMLYWFYKEYPMLFEIILNKLGIDTSRWSLKKKMYREKDYYDLSVIEDNNSNNGDFLFILENKVKSVPTLTQLIEYKNKQNKNHRQTTSTQYLLLSLCTEFPEKEDVEKSGWKIKSYFDLWLAISGVINLISNVYHKELMTDYCEYILQLHKIQLDWQLNPQNKYIETVVNIDSNEEFKLNDVKKKVLVSLICVELKNRLQNDPNFANRVILGSNKTIIEDINYVNKRPVQGNVYIFWGMSRSNGLVDVKFVDSNNMVFVIQVQGTSYRHCIEQLTNNKTVHIQAITKYINSNKNPLIPLLNTYTDYLDDFNDALSLMKIKSNIIYPKNNSYNKFGSSFIYRSVNVEDDVLIEQVIDAIIADLKNFFLPLLQTKNTFAGPTTTNTRTRKKKTNATKTKNNTTP